MAIKKLDADKFYRQMMEKTREEGVPVKVNWELTYRCNFSCVHCKITLDRRKKELTSSQIKKIIDQAGNAGCFYIHFTGGEPLLRKDIFEILAYAKKKGFRFSLATNASLINKEVADKLASLRPNLSEVNTSMLGVTKKTVENLTGVRGSFTKVIDGMKRLRKKGIKVGVNTTLLAPNKDEFLLTKDFANRLNAEWRCNFVVLPKSSGDRSPLKYSLTPEVVHSLFKKIVSKERATEQMGYAAQEVKYTGRKRLFMCGVGRSDITISPYGEMNLCPYISYPQYNILKGSFKDGWRKIKQIVKKLTPTRNYFCRDCALARFCPWCPAKAFLERKHFTGCSYFDRQLALLGAKDSSYWDKIAPLWKKQSKRFIKRKRQKNR